METSELQRRFFLELKARVPHHLSMAEEIAELLNISTDSAYRRIRGEKPIDMVELQKLCAQYRISLDHLLSNAPGSTIFYGNWADADTFNFEKYLQGLLTDITNINAAGKKILYYDAKDIPLFHLFQFPELAAFKYFFWMRTILSYPGYSKLCVEDNDLSEILRKTGTEITKKYTTVPSIEIWTFETIHSNLQQIKFYEQSGIFRKKETAEMLYEQVLELVSHIEAEAECGEKFLYGEQPAGFSNNFQLFFNEVSTGHNTVLAETDDIQSVYINHGVMNYMMTRDKDFCGLTKKSLENVMRKSTLISLVSEKERNRFFLTLKEKIAYKMRESILI